MKPGSLVQFVKAATVLSKRTKIRRVAISVSVVTLFFTNATELQAQTFNEWTNSGTDWGTTTNWSGGGVGNYGQLEFKGNGNVSSNNNAGVVSQWRVYFSNTKAYTLTSSSGALNLFDFGGAHSWILSDSTVKQTFSSLTVNFAATAGATFGQISARNTGELAFNNVGITGSQVAQLRIAGQSTGKVTFSGGISGTGKAVVIGIDESGGSRTSTDVVFNGASTYTGDTFINAGKLTIGSGGSLTSTIQLGDTVATGAAATFALGASSGGQSLGNTINVRGGSAGTKTIDSLNTSGTNILTGAITLDADLLLKQAAGGSLTTSTGAFDIKALKLTVDTATAGTVTISQALTSSLGAGGFLVKQGGGTLILSNTANGYTGTSNSSLNANGTQIAGGTLGIYGDGSLGNAPAGAYNNIQFTASGTLQDTANNISLHANRSISIANGATASFDSNGNTLAINGIVNGTGGNVNKTGNGTLSLNGNNTYTGTTTASAGILAINGNQTSATGNVFVNAKLTGTGTIGGATMVNASGTLAPTAQTSGNKMTIASTVDFASNSIFEWDLNAGTSDPGGNASNSGNYGQLLATGAASGTSVFTIVLGTNTYAAAFWDTNKSWSNVFSASGLSALNTLFTTFAGAGLTASGSGATAIATAAGEGHFSFSGTTLQWTAVPEPTSSLAGLLIGVGLLRRRRD
ncbi:MAG: autotransporter-associated beta strand repeat-containing protein [Luteolibacter sp.]